MTPTPDGDDPCAESPEHDRAEWLAGHRPGYLPHHWTPGVDPQWIEAALRAATKLRQQASDVIHTALRRIVADPSGSPMFADELDSGEIRALFDLGMGPTLLAYTVNTALGEPLHTFPRAQVLTLELRPVEKSDLDIFGDDRPSLSR